MDGSDWTRVEARAKAVLAAHQGVAKLAAFLDADLTAHQVAALLRRGSLQRPRSGWYTDPALPWQAYRAIRVGGVLCCVSACDSFGLPIPHGAGGRLHVLLPANAPRVRHSRDRRHYVVPREDPEVVRHWSRHDGTPIGWRTPLLDALVALADCVPQDWWVAAVDGAAHRPRGGEPLLDEVGLERLRDLLPVRMRSALADVDGSAESCLETLVRLGMARRGIGQVHPQFVPHPAYRADFLVGPRLLVEVDGAEFHDPEADRVRDTILTALGYVVLRFTYDDVVHDLDAVLDRIQAVLATI
jgi:very-short-patch-repair endonuclease